MYFNATKLSPDDKVEKKKSIENIADFLNLGFKFFRRKKKEENFNKILFFFFLYKQKNLYF